MRKSLLCVWDPLAGLLATFEGSEPRHKTAFPEGAPALGSRVEVAWVQRHFKVGATRGQRQGPYVLFFCSRSARVPM